ncbi:MAG: hypothetical protein HQ478_16260 [Chloroflexi bacterium]|nr:hypothetical protein [Chloroflexota bacterium]
MARLIRLLANFDTEFLRVLLRQQMYLDKRRVQAIGVVIAVIAGALILVRAGTTDRIDATDFDQADTVVTEQRAIEIAFQEAQKLGLVDAPEAWLARRISFGEYSTLAGDQARAFAGTPDISPTAVTWVISMNGEWSTPLLGDSVVNFDNIVVVLDAISGEPLQVATYFEQFESDVRLPRLFDPAEPCAERDLGVFKKIFRSTCPWPVPGENK